MEVIKGKVKVLLVSPLPPPASGIATWSEIVLSAVEADEDLELEHVDTAVRWRSTNDTRLWVRITGGALQALRDAIRVLFHCLKKKPDLLHLCTSGKLAIPKDILILYFCKKLGIQTILHYHRGDLPKIIAQNGVESKMLRRASLFSDIFLLLDRFSHNCFSATWRESISVVIPNPIDSQAISMLGTPETNGDAQTTTIVFAGWVVPSKGVTELVEACLLLKNPLIKLVLAGNVLEEYKAFLMKRAEDLNGGKWLSFCGMLPRSETLKVIDSADIFVLPSHTEGFPNVVLEAMALGKPIIASRVGAIPDMLDENSDTPCGLLVEPKDIVALKNALCLFAGDPAKAKIYASRAHRKLESSYTKEKVVGQYANLWRSLATASRGAGFIAGSTRYDHVSER